MELHSCTNCELIDEVISNEVQKFDALSKENVTLHVALVKARKSIMDLESEMANLHKVIAEERMYNLHLYLQQQPFGKESQVAINVILNPDTKKVAFKTHRDSPRKTLSKSSPRLEQVGDKQVSLSTYNELKDFCEKQEQIYDDNIRLLQTTNDNCVSKLKEQISNMQDHLSEILEMYEVYRAELFKQKKESTEEHKSFLKTLDILRQENAKHMKDVFKNMSEKNVSIINEQVKEFSTSLNHAIEKRDKLVNILRRQQITLEQQIEELKKQEGKKQQELKRINDELRKQLKHSQEKYSALEQRRVFDAEGFRTDISQIRKDLARLKTSFFKDKSVDPKCESFYEFKKLEKKIDQIDSKLYSCYIKTN